MIIVICLRNSADNSYYRITFDTRLRLPFSVIRGWCLSRWLFNYRLERSGRLNRIIIDRFAVNLSIFDRRRRKSRKFDSSKNWRRCKRGQVTLAQLTRSMYERTEKELLYARLIIFFESTDAEGGIRGAVNRQLASESFKDALTVSETSSRWKEGRVESGRVGLSRLDSTRLDSTRLD